MEFLIKNETGRTITLGGTDYNTNDYVSLKNHINFQGIQYTRTDIDGPNTGRGLDGTLIRDRVASKGKWQVSLFNAIEASQAQAILSLVEPETFHIKTDIPNGVLREYLVYANSIPVTSYIFKDNKEYYTGISIPIAEI